MTFKRGDKVRFRRMYMTEKRFAELEGTLATFRDRVSNEYAYVILDGHEDVDGNLFQVPIANLEAAPDGGPARE